MNGGLLRAGRRRQYRLNPFVVPRLTRQYVVWSVNTKDRYILSEKDARASAMKRRGDAIDQQNARARLQMVEL